MVENMRLHELPYSPNFGIDLEARLISKGYSNILITLPLLTNISPDSNFSEIGAGRQAIYDIYADESKIGSYSLKIILSPEKAIARVQYEGIIPGYTDPRLNLENIPVGLMKFYPDLIQRRDYFIRDDIHIEIPFS